MNAVRLRTEYLRNPLGIDLSSPRLFWNCEDGTVQTAYQVITTTTDGKELWNSGKVESSQMAGIPFRGKLISRQKVCWRVRLWDENGVPGDFSEEASFEMGLLEPDDWKARWITGRYAPKTKKDPTRGFRGAQPERYPVDCFRKSFSLTEIGSARLYITACGLYEAYLNGKRVGDFVMAPGHTDYRKRVQYQTYDISELIHIGENTLEIMLADGWYRGSTGAWGLLSEYGYETKLLVQLEVNGSPVAVSDDSWAWSNDGAIRFADNKDGEIVDARMMPSYSGRAKLTKHNVVPTASNNVPVTEHERLQVQKVITTPSGKKVLDFSQNIAGFISFTVSAKAGQAVRLICGELIDENGELTLKNIQLGAKGKVTPMQQVEYICKDGENRYKNRFAVFGFQYVQVDTDVQWEAEDFTAVAVYSDLERTGWFESSNKLLDQFVENTVWSAKNNFLDVPTDCPTRERHGWSGDAQLFCKTAGYLFNAVPFMQKYLNDLYDWQKKNGCLPQIAPAGGVDFYMDSMNGSVGWADAGVLMPWALYQLTNDKNVLSRYWDGMVKYAAFMKKRTGRRSLLCAPGVKLKGKDRKYAVNCGQSYGEWAEPADVHPNKWTDMILPHPEESTAYTACVMDTMAKIAAVLGKEAEAADYHDFAENVKASYQAMRRLPAFPLDTDRQARLVRPLSFGLLNGEQAAFAKKRLIQALDHYGWRLGTGFLSTPLILDVLADIDIEYAYKLLENEEMPGWLFMPKMGATTVWESWEGTQAQGGIASLNHYSKGACVEWLFQTMCGIRISGENRFVIAPRPGGSFTHAAASYKSVYGTVESKWERRDGQTLYSVTIPANCTAEIRLPGLDAVSVCAGTQEWEV